MYIYPLMLIPLFFLARALSVYHPHLLWKKYMVIRKTAVAKIFISQSDPVNPNAKNTTENRNKMTYLGLVFYILLLLWAGFTVFMQCIAPISCEPFIWDSRILYVMANTLNMVLPFLVSVALLFAEAGLLFQNTAKYAMAKTKAKVFVGVLYYFFTAVSFVGLLSVLYFIFILI